MDGLNSIDAKRTSARDSTKWVLGPHQTITLDGWQTDASTARRFYFTTEDESYGAWLGDTRNLGIVSAAVFREKLVRPTPITRQRSGKAGRRSAADRPGPPIMRVDGRYCEDLDIEEAKRIVDSLE